MRREGTHGRTPGRLQAQPPSAPGRRPADGPASCPLAEESDLPQSRPRSMLVNGRARTDTVGLSRPLPRRRRSICPPVPCPSPPCPAPPTSCPPSINSFWQTYAPAALPARSRTTTPPARCSPPTTRSTSWHRRPPSSRRTPRTCSAWPRCWASLPTRRWRWHRAAAAPAPTASHSLTGW